MDLWFYFLLFVAGMAGAAGRDFIGWWRSRFRWTCPECGVRFSTNTPAGIDLVRTRHTKDAHPWGEDVLIGLNQRDCAFYAARHEGKTFYKQVANSADSRRYLEGLRIKQVYVTPEVMAQGLDEFLFDIIHGNAVRMGRTLEQTIRVLG